MSSGPVELLFMLFQRTKCTCVVISRIFSVERVLTVWPICLLVLFVHCGVIFVHCWLKAFALSMSVMALLVPKRMLLFCCKVFFVTVDKFVVVPHRKCALCL